jgi:UDP-2,3-diacylglucosamine hydrolase
MKKTMFLSDVHITPAVPARMTAFLDFLLRERAHLKTLYILGDLFEFWLGRQHLRLPDYQVTLRVLREMARSAIDIYFVHGNRDFHVDSSFQRSTGVKVLGESAEIELTGRKALLLHGDMLCANDLHYHSYRRFVRSPVGKSLFRAMPLPAKTLVAKCMTLASHYSGSTRNGGQRSLSRRKIMDIFRDGYELVICGHVHQPGETKWVVEGRERMLYVLGNWYCRGAYLEFDGKNFCMKNALNGAP